MLEAAGLQMAWILEVTELGVGVAHVQEILLQRDSQREREGWGNSPRPGHKL